MSDDSIGYRIVHQTRYAYSDPVATCQNQIRMQPSTRLGLVCHSTDVTIEPPPDRVAQHRDYYGNRVYSFAIESLHRSLTVNVQSVVTVQTPVLPQDLLVPEWEQLADLDQKAFSPDGQVPITEFRFDSPRIARSSVFAQYALKSFTPRRDVVTALLDLTQRIHKDFRYDPDATEVDTSTEAAFQLRAGVCQDFAHIQIACLRSIGLSARYVSGYLRTIPAPGKAPLVGADESHAWISAYAGPEFGWIACDPTNATFAGNQHIPVCAGRDYDDVSPMRGVVLGGGKTKLEVSVDVTPIEPVTS
ncbi:MAG: transglutaminase family protein [Pirellulaceae bacterium]|nr:transglutaminase family protein [Pirellulaceae bacterium]